MRMVLAALLEAPAADHYGLSIADRSGLKSGSLYPILNRLEDHGWLTSTWEDVDPSEEGRPRRRYYRLTGEGTALARSALESAPPAIARWLPGGAT